ncbi:MAG: DUF6691 family protein [Cypionkella sp.]|nr:DUF6691 family protein [Cypionkella sp.]
MAWRTFMAAVAGAVFGLGLMVSGMTDTRAVQAFLDIFGAWDPTLIFVMGGAIVPMAIAWRVAAKRKSSVLGGSFPSMPPPRFDRNLIGGSMAFGAGWAITGFCPGPAIASLSFGGWQGAVFFVAMAAGALAAAPLRAKN